MQLERSFVHVEALLPYFMSVNRPTGFLEKVVKMARVVYVAGK